MFFKYGWLLGGIVLLMNIRQVQAQKAFEKFEPYGEEFILGDIPASPPMQPNIKAEILEDRIFIQRGNFEIIRIETPPTMILTPIPGIISVQWRKPDFLFIFGDSIGQTTITVFGEQDVEIFKTIIEVQH